MCGALSYGQHMDRVWDLVMAEWLGDRGGDKAGAQGVTTRLHSGVRQYRERRRAATLRLRPLNAAQAARCRRMRGCSMRERSARTLPAYWDFGSLEAPAYLCSAVSVSPNRHRYSRRICTYATRFSRRLPFVTLGYAITVPCVRRRGPSS